MSVVAEMKDALRRLHLNYNMITSLYMMEPMERTLVNCFLLLVLSLMMYSSWVYLPHYTFKLLVFSGILRPENSIVGETEEFHPYSTEL